MRVVKLEYSIRSGSGEIYRAETDYRTAKKIFDQYYHRWGEVTDLNLWLERGYIEDGKYYEEMRHVCTSKT